MYTVHHILSRMMWVGRVARIVETNANLFNCYEFSPLKATESESTFPSSCPCRTQILEGSQASPACPSDNSCVKMKMSTDHWRSNTDRGKRNTGTETSHSATLCTTNLTWTDIGSNTRLCGDRPVTDSCHRVTELHSPHHVLVTHNCSATGRSVVACYCYCRTCVSV